MAATKKLTYGIRGLRCNRGINCELDLARFVIPGCLSIVDCPLE